MFMGRLDQPQHDLGMQSEQRFARSLPALVALMIDEILDSADEDQWSGFFRTIGARLAQGIDLDGIEETEDLLDEVNALWKLLGWGHVGFELDDEGIDIYHRDMPATLEADGAHNWEKVAPYILLGAYEDWFHALGGGELSTRIVRLSSDVIHLRHGY